MNWFIKQFFYLRFYFCQTGRLKIKNKYPNTVFNYQLWQPDGAGWKYSSTKHLYGKYLFLAKLDGAFEEIIWPALWMIDDRQINHYYEFDIELMKGNKRPYLVFTSWVNKLSNDPYTGNVQRIRLNNQFLVRKLRSEFNEFVIDWQQNGWDL